MGDDLSQFLGVDEFDLAQKLIEAAADDTAKAVAGTIKSHRTVWLAKGEDERKKLSGQALLRTPRHIGHRVNCPACGSIAIVTGEPISSPVMKINDDVITEKQQYLPNKFECVACSLKISGLSYLSHGGIGDSFTSTQQYDAVEYYAADDEMWEYEPDFNE